MKSLLVAVAVTLLATGGSAVAQTATDARCILLANAFAAQGSDAKQQKVAEDTLYFYLGRISGNPTAAQMKAVMDAQGKTITDANAGPMMNDCVKPVLEKVQVLQTLSNESKPASPTQTPAQPEGR